MSTQIKQTQTLTAIQLKKYIKDGVQVSVMKDGQLRLVNTHNFWDTLTEEIEYGPNKFEYEVIYSAMCNELDIYEKNDAGRNYHSETQEVLTRAIII